jgi:putative ABC transport system ATP-binding protein
MAGPLLPSPHDAAPEPLIVARGVNHFYGRGALRKQILHAIDLAVEPGEIVIMTGPSGSGKTTLLTLIGALRSAQEGSLRVLGHELRDAGEERLIAVRRQIGYIFQSHNLMRSLNAQENVELGLEIQPLSPAERQERARAALEAVGLGERRHHFPDEMSGGQKQRVAIARALAPRPRLILADEPTASLDKQSGRDVVDLMNDLARRQRCAVLLVTHDNRILDIADRIVHLEDGHLQSFAAAVSTEAQRMLDALIHTTRENDIAARVQGLADEAFATFLAQVTQEFEQLLRVMELSGSDAFESMLEQVLEAFTLRIGRMLRADRATLFVVDREHGFLWSKVADKAGLIKLALGQGIAGRVAQTGEAMNIADAYQEPLFNRRVDDETGYRTRTMLCMPVKNAAGEVFAVMQLLNKADGALFDDADAKHFAHVAERMGVILQAWARMARRTVMEPPAGAA